MRKLKKLLAVVLVLTMAVSILGTSAVAAGAEKQADEYSADAYFTTYHDVYIPSTGQPAEITFTYTYNYEPLGMELSYSDSSKLGDFATATVSENGAVGFYGETYAGQIDVSISGKKAGEAQFTVSYDHLWLDGGYWVVYNHTEIIRIHVYNPETIELNVGDTKSYNFKGSGDQGEIIDDPVASTSSVSVNLDGNDYYGYDGYTVTGMSTGSASVVTRYGWYTSSGDRFDNQSISQYVDVTNFNVTDPKSETVTVKFNDGEAGGQSFHEQDYYPEKRDNGNYEDLFNTSEHAHAAQVDDNGNPMWTGYIFTGWARSEDRDGNVTYTAQWKKDVPTGPVPSLETLQKKITGVYVDCVTAEGEHETRSYSVLEGSYTVGDLYTPAGGGAQRIDVTFDAAKYVTQYNSDIGVDHTSVDGSDKIVVSFMYQSTGANDEAKWWLVKDGMPGSTKTTDLTFNVEHIVTPPEPAKEVTGFTKVRLTAAPEGITVSGDVNYEASPEIPYGGSVTLLYAITVTGTPGTEYEVTDEGATYVGGDQMKGEIPEDGNAVIYVTKTFMQDDAADGSLTNTAKVEPGTGSNDNSTVTAQTTVTKGEEPRNTYTLTFDANDGKFDQTAGGYNRPNESIRQLVVSGTTEESHIFTADDIARQTPPVRDGYTFKGWTTEPNVGTPVTSVTVTKDTPAATIYALWEEDAPAAPTGDQINGAKVTIICINNQNLGHEDMPSDLIAKSVIEVSEPELGEDGKWYSTFKVDASKYTHKYDTANHHDVAPTPEHNNDTYKIVYAGKDKKGNPTWELADGEDIKVYVRDMVTYSIQYVFKDAEGNVFEPTGDLAALVAKFAKGNKYRSIGQYIDTKPDDKTSYTSNLENEYPTSTAYPKYIDDNGTLYACDKDNYSFNISDNAEENIVTVTYTAQSAKYTVTFDHNDGDETHKDTVEVVDGNTTDDVHPTVGDQMPADPTRDGYVFEGWVDGNDNSFTGETPVTGDVTVTAKWAVDANHNKIPDETETKITVTYRIVNGTWSDNTTADKTVEILPGMTLGDTVPTGNPNAGYTAPGTWSASEPTAETVVSANTIYTLTFPAAYVPPTPTVTYYDLTVEYVDGEGNTIRDAETSTHPSGYAYDVDAPEIEGYTFDHAEGETAGTLTSDTTVTLVYTAVEEIPDPEPPLTEDPDPVEPGEPDPENPGTTEPDPEDPGTTEPDPGEDLPDEDVPKTDEPGTDIPDEDVPKTDEPGTDIPDEDVPKTDEPGTDEPTEEIPDEDVPLDDVPKTGDDSCLPVWALLTVLSALGLGYVALPRRKKN